ncbi:hypothetical protein ACOMHN_039664 [Nucella lapillus]
MEPCTQTITVAIDRLYHSYFSMINAFSVVVLDGPGLFDTGHTNTEVARRLLLAFAQIPGTDVVCYVVEVGGYTEEDYGAFQRLRAMLGEGLSSHLLLLFTHGDRLGGKDVTAILKDAPACLRSILQENGNQYVVFDNRAGDRQEQVQRLVQTARGMKERNGGRLFTCPAYVSTHLNSELTARFDGVDRSEGDRSAFVQRLQANLGQAQHSASSQRQELDRRTQESEESSRRERDRLQRGVNDISTRLSQQHVSNSSVTSQLQALQGRLTQEQQQRQQELQQLQSQHAAAIQQKNAEIASLR